MPSAQPPNSTLQAPSSAVALASGPGSKVVRLPLADALPAVPSLGVDGEGKSRLEKLLQVGDLAKATGKTVRAIHHYEELGLLKPDARSKGRFRLYDPAAVTRVRWIGKLHDLGLSLGQIQDVVSTWEAAPTAGRAMAKVRTMYVERLAETRAQIERLRALEAELEASIDYLDTCETCDLELLSAGSKRAGSAKRARSASSTEATHEHTNGASCSACQHRDQNDEPELVAGIHAGGEASERREQALAPP